MVEGAAPWMSWILSQVPVLSDHCYYSSPSAPVPPSARPPCDPFLLSKLTLPVPAVAATHLYVQVHLKVHPTVHCVS